MIFQNLNCNGQSVFIIAGNDKVRYSTVQYIILVCTLRYGLGVRYTHLKDVLYRTPTTYVLYLTVCTLLLSLYLGESSVV